MSFAHPDKDSATGRVRMADLARLAGVSVATVSRSLSDSPLIHPATKTRVWQVACRHGYAAERDMPSALRPSASSLAVMIPAGRGGRVFDPGLAELMTGVVAAALDSRCQVLFSHVHDNGALDAVMRGLAADAYLFLDEGDLHEALGRLPDASAARFVAWGERGFAAPYGTIAPDHFAAGRMATAHLTCAGCRSIAYVGDTEGPEMSQRFMGYLTALHEAGVSFDPRLLMRSPASPPERPFDGLFVAAEAALASALRGPGRDVPVVAWYNGSGLFPGDAPLALVSADMTAAGRRIVARLLQAGEPCRDCERLPVTLRVL